jgi:FlaA1/EpsC-like NDP-sugar epimerase
MLSLHKCVALAWAWKCVAVFLAKTAVSARIVFVIAAACVRQDAMNRGGSILITGAGGCIGSALAERLAKSGARKLILLDHAEHELHEIAVVLGAIEGSATHVAVLGDICDATLLAEVFEEHRPAVIYHAAAFKHVPMMEENPLAAVRNNIIGTLILAQAARRHEAAQLVMISTDKAVNPRSVMGVSKRIAELVLLRWNGIKTQMKSVRLGNVLGSRGSVVPLFQRQIARGGPVTVTHPDVSRYFVTLREGADLILAATNLEGAVFVADFGEPVKIVDLARGMIRKAGFEPEVGMPIVFTELRPGEKLSEEMIFASEMAEPTEDARIRRVRGLAIAADDFDRKLALLAAGVERRDTAALVDALARIVPEYKPSESLRGAKKPLTRAAGK